MRERERARETGIWVWDLGLEEGWGRRGKGEKE